MTRVSKLRIALTVFAIAALAAALPLAAQGFGPGRGQAGGPGFGPGPGDGAAAGALGPGPGPGLHLGRLASYLELTDEQIASAKTIFDDARTAAQPIHQAQMDLRDQLATLLDSENPDPTEVGNLVLELHANRESVKAIFDAAIEDFKALLTADQLAKFEKLQDIRRHFGAPGLPGDEGGPAA